ncbi:tetratricopeptide repeat protein [Sutterella wadsworthensis]|uniref:tetratricopeptide repeat protein n=1 Tax=Sutterella wadsworthensis TaxID=40545 RepID=UPI001E36A53A|nr:tetratricopeptide repeat protein [Sutterella wadsworthensis]
MTTSAHSSCRGPQAAMKTAALFALWVAALMLSGCASLAGAGSDSPMPERTIKERTPSEVVTAPKKDRESALRLARMLVAQGRYEGALGVYAELDRRGGMDAKTLLEYAGIASLIEPPRATLTLFTRTKALAEAEKVQFSPAEEAGLLTGLGRAYMASARMSDARSALERAVELDDKNVSALNAYGIVLDAAGEHEEAVKYFDKALAQSPTNVQVLNNLALAKLGMNDAKGALKVLGDAENFSSSDASGVLTPKMNLAFVQFMTGSADRSRETLQSFMTNEQAEEALKKFAAMKSRIDAGESTLADECLRAAEKMIEIRPKSADDSDYGYEVPLVVEPVKTIETNGGAGLSSHAQTFPKGSPEAAAALEALKKGSAGQNGSKP